MITSLREMLELPSFGHIYNIYVSTICYESLDKILLVRSWTEIMTSQPLLQHTFNLRRPVEAHLLKLPRKIQTRLKELDIMY